MAIGINIQTLHQTTYQFTDWLLSGAEIPKDKSLLILNPCRF